MNSPDVIIIGGGPNGLTSGAYLAKAGLDVLLLESRHEIGGGLAGEEVTTTGLIHNPHALYFLLVDYAPPYFDFNQELAPFIKHIYPEVQISMVRSDGKSLTLFSDPEKTAKSIEKFSRSDSETYRKMYGEYLKIVEDIIIPYTFAPPIPPVEQMDLLSKTETGQNFTEITEMTPREIVEENFEDELVKALFLYVGTHPILRYDEPLGYLFPLYFIVSHRMRIVEGGTHRLASALAKIIIRNGGMIHEASEVAEIIVEDGVAKGVRLKDGRKIMAKKAILSTVDPPQTFLKLIGEDKIDMDLSNIKNWEWEEFSFFSVHADLTEPPVYRSDSSDPNRALITLIGYDSSEEYITEMDAVLQGRFPERPACEVTCPTVFDPTQAYGQPGMHTLRITSYAPFELDGDAEKWDTFKNEAMDRCLSVLKDYTENMNQDSIRYSYPQSPLDIERRIPSMVKGSIKHGAYIPFQMGYMRPNTECSGYRTPIKNLYVGGAGVYPGGWVSFGPGYNSANAILEDLGVEKWFSEPEFIKRAKENGYL